MERSLLALLILCGLTGCPGQEKQCDVSGHACTWAGLPGEFGFDGDGQDRRDTMLYWAMDMKFASDGTPWFIDWNNHLLRKVLPDDTVATVVGWTDPVFPGDGSQPASAERTADGVLGTTVQLNHPTDIAELADGTILLMAWHNHKLRAINPDTGNVRILYGAGAGYAGDGGPATLALFKQPKALEVDGDGNIYILDQQNFRIRMVDGDGNINTIVGSGVQGEDGDGGDATACTLGFEAGSNPEPSGGMALDGAGKLYVADTLGNRIRVVDLAAHTIDAFAGTGDQGYTGDGGPAAQAQFAHPRDLEIGPDGDLYVADTDNSVIRAINPTTGDIRTVAGTGAIGLDPDDDHLALETTLARPFGIEFDPAGALYISDTINSRILRVAP
jgi:streptogramin lyase